MKPVSFQLSHGLLHHFYPSRSHLYLFDILSGRPVVLKESKKSPVNQMRRKGPSTSHICTLSLSQIINDELARLISLRNRQQRPLPQTQHLGLFNSLPDRRPTLHSFHLPPILSFSLSCTHKHTHRICYLLICQNEEILSCHDNKANEVCETTWM